MIHDVEFTSLFLYAIFLSSQANTNLFDDSVLFSINWPGPVENLNLDSLTEDKAVVVMTQEKEKYKCILPAIDITDGNKDKDESWKGPEPMELLSPLFTQTACSYRIDTYWTYELCHGKHLRQYHEEKEPGKKAKLQQFFLGHFKKPEADDKPESSASEHAEEGKEVESTAEEIQKEEETPGGQTKKTKRPVIKIDGTNLPYFEVMMKDGTVCDLSGGHRQTSVKYVCHQNGRGEIYELKEIVTCEYEAVVLTRELCSHPDFREKKDPVNTIKCHPLEGAPRRPVSLDLLELENSQGRYTSAANQGLDDDEDDDDDEDSTNNFPKREPTYREIKRPSEPISETADKQLLRDFLKGEYCITGGSGWWKHEFCYGQYVLQFHEEKDKRDTIYLGYWHKEEHLSWLEKNPHKKPKKVGERKYIVQHYSKGDFCDLSGKNRHVEVKLRCIDNPKQPHAVAIYLVEPSTCQYNLVVESPILCPLIDEADDNNITENL